MSELAALVARRLCHDLAGPAGAIATVVELMRDGIADPELQSLLTESTATLLSTLRMHRFVLGGGDSSDYRACLGDWIATREGVALHWADEPERPPTQAALLLGLAMIAAEAARGAATLTVADTGVTITGARLSLDAEVAATLGGAAATSKGALAALLYQAAAGQGWTIVVDERPTQLELKLA